jgi:uncharacterized protein
VLVHTNLALSGAVAQYGRGVGIIQATAAQLMNQFATRLKDDLAQDRSTAPAPTQPMQSPIASTAAPPPAKPISGLALLAKAIWSWITGLFRPR